MRYVSSAFLESTLRRAKPLEQFLGGSTDDGQLSIRWVELRPTKNAIEVWHFVAPDYGDEEHLDFYEFIGVDEGVLEATVPSPADALVYAERALGALPNRWVNQFVSQDEYRDFILAGRPPKWPMVGA